MALSTGNAPSTSLSKANADIVSEVLDPNGKPIVLSRVSDSVWDLSPHFKNLNRNHAKQCIDFSFLMPDHSKFTDERNIFLLKGAKDYLFFRLLHRSLKSGLRLKASTVINEFEALKVLVRWMAQFQLKKFSMMTADKCAEYGRWCNDEKNKLRNGDVRPRFSSGKKVVLLRVLGNFYTYKESLSDPIPEYPWQDFSLSEIAGHDQGADIAKTEKIPDRLAIKLGKISLEYIEDRSSRLLDARDAVALMQARQTENPIDISDGKMRKARSRSINRFLVENNLPTLRKFQQELFYLRTACYIVVALLSGMRTSEIASLKIGAYSTGQDENDEPYGWLSGLTYKFVAVPTMSTWLVPPAVGRAIAVLERFGEPLRKSVVEYIDYLNKELGRPQHTEGHRLGLVQSLIAAEHSHNALWLGEKPGDPAPVFLSDGSTLIWLKKFSAHIGLTVESHDLLEIHNRKKIVAGTVWPLSHHQFRRTFAIFVARNRMGDLRYLRHHFKHWTIDMTLFYVKEIAVDDALIADIDDERQNLQATLMEEWLVGSTSLSGGAGHRIMEIRRSKGHIHRNPKEFVRQIGERLFVRGTGHSWCLADGAGCGGQGLYDMGRCVGCGDSVIDVSQKAIWQGIFFQQIEVLKWPDIGEPIRQRCMEHLKLAVSVLTDLGEPISSETLKNIGIADYGT